jgi:hypothetical protein
VPGGSAKLRGERRFNSPEYQEHTMIGGLDLSTVNWLFVGLMCALAFITALLGSLIAFRNRVLGAVIAAILFGIGFIAWNYYPHSFGLPVLKSVGLDTPAS